MSQITLLKSDSLLYKISSKQCKQLSNVIIRETLFFQATPFILTKKTSN